MAVAVVSNAAVAPFKDSSRNHSSDELLHALEAGLQVGFTS
jgi:hypothetical protein